MEVKKKKPVIIFILVLAGVVLGGWLVLKLIYIDLPGIPFGKDHLINTLLNEDNRSDKFSKKRIPLEILSEILWAGYGRTSDNQRTVLSLADYPAVLYTFIDKDIITDLRSGVYEYIIKAHDLKLKNRKDISSELKKALKIDHPAPVIIFITCNQTIYQAKKDEVYFEAGQITANILLKSRELKMKIKLIPGHGLTRITDIPGLDGQSLLYAVVIGY